MRRTELLQEVRKMRFEEILGIWNKRDITQEEAALITLITGSDLTIDFDFRKERGLHRLVMYDFPNNPVFYYCA